MRFILSIIAGGLFGAGLFLSGMTDTTKVQGWLDVFGAWDPTLAFVMGGAIIPMMIAWRLTPGARPLPAVISLRLRFTASVTGWCWARSCSVWDGGWPVCVRGHPWLRSAMAERVVLSFWPPCC